MSDHESPKELAGDETEVELDDAARMLGIAVALVRRRMDDGRLPFRQEGGTRFAKAEDLAQAKAELERQERLLRAVAETEEIDFQPEPKP
jgi:hypothetical protein